jgi:hypothetical protein
MFFTKGMVMTGEARVRTMLRARLFVLGLCAAAWPLSLRTTVLPHDMREAEIMLKEGSLDSLEWELLQPYYVQPIVVPRGELSLLHDLFDVRVGNLPVTQEQLSPYEPWDGAARERFFDDYPELAKYAPILSFSQVKTSRMSNVGLGIVVGDDWNTTAQSRFSLQPRPGVSVSGSLTHGDSAALWKKRGISFSIPDVVSVQAGNFYFGDDGGLFYGYFPADSSPPATASNWRYGTSRTWNGMCVQSDRWSKARISAFYHERTTEQALGVFCEAGPSQAFHVTTGLSRLSRVEHGDSSLDADYFFHCGLSGLAAGYTYSLHAGAARSNPRAVPVSAQCTRKSGDASVTVLVARVPGSLSLTRSKLAFDCRNELDLGDTAAGSDMTLADCRTRVRLSPACATSFFVSYVNAKNRAAISAGAGASGRAFVNYRMSYSYHMSTTAAEESHKALLSVERAFSRFVKPGLSCSGFLTSTGFGSLLARCPVEVSFAPALTVTPYATWYAATSPSRSGSLGLKESLKLFERTWCECDVATSFDEHNKQEWNINARSYFSF